MLVDSLLRPDVHLYLIGFMFMLAGLLHFLKPALYLKIMPDYIPRPKAMVYLSGIAEIAGGLGMLVPFVRFEATIGLILLLIAVFPANIDMAVKNIQRRGWFRLYSILLIVRLPLQFVLMYWVYWAGIKH